jgi:hypothetical protein
MVHLEGVLLVDTKRLQLNMDTVSSIVEGSGVGTVNRGLQPDTQWAIVLIRF